MYSILNDIYKILFHLKGKLTWKRTTLSKGIIKNVTKPPLIGCPKEDYALIPIPIFL